VLEQSGRRTLIKQRTGINPPKFCCVLRNHFADMRFLPDNCCIPVSNKEMAEDFDTPHLRFSEIPLRQTRFVFTLFLRIK
jgi:hypothetical protein